MSGTNLLNTSTVSFLELVGNGKTFAVPPYQRDYSWTDEQWEDLWEDIVELRPNNNSRHYMGAVVFRPETDRKFIVIDGQQRIATLTILALAVIGRLHTMGVTDEDRDANNERARALRARFIGEKDPASLTEISKLVLNEHDNGFFQDYLVQLREPSNPRGLKKSNSLLWNCYHYYTDKIKADPELKISGLKLAELLSEVVARRLLFIQIVVQDDLSAYTVFETLNARGLELTTSDLLKNYLFSIVKSANDLEAVQRQWQRLVTTVQQERFAEFLRYHYLTKHRQIRSGRLFKLIRDEVKSSAQVLELMRELESRAELFSALADHNHTLWLDLGDAKPFIRELNLFRVKQMTPLLFAAYEKLSANDFVRVLKLVAVISFRYTIVSSRKPSELESIYHDAAAAVLSGLASTPASVFTILEPIYVEDGPFRANFADLSIPTSGPRRRLARYILAKLESSAGPAFIDPDDSPATIEHILPQNPGEMWVEMVPRSQWEAYTYRLGNLALIEAPLNREVGSGSYADKAVAYARSIYKLTSQIPIDAPEDWTVDRIVARQLKLAKRAEHIWRIDFAPSNASKA